LNRWLLCLVFYRITFHHGLFILSSSWSWRWGKMKHPTPKPSNNSCARSRCRLGAMLSAHKLHVFRSCILSSFFWHMVNFCVFHFSIAIFVVLDGVVFTISFVTASSVVWGVELGILSSPAENDAILVHEDAEPSMPLCVATIARQCTSIFFNHPCCVGANTPSFLPQEILNPNIKTTCLGSRVQSLNFFSILASFGESRL